MIFVAFNWVFECALSDLNTNSMGSEEIEVDVRRMHAGCLKFGLQLVFGLHCSLA